MGRTNPTYRARIDALANGWDEFRRSLRHEDQAAFDAIVTHMRDHATAGGAVNPTEPKWAMYLSVLLEQEKRIQELEDALADQRG